MVNIGGTDEISILDLAERIRGVAGSASKIVFVPYEKAYAPGFEDMQRRVPDVRRIHSLLGWHQEIPLDETLSRVRDWLCQWPEGID